VVLLALIAALIPVSLLALGYAVLGEPYWPRFKRHHLPLPPTWPEDLSIVHISDLHVRRQDQRLLRTQRRALSGMRPDLLCVTGDVCEKVEDIPLLVDVLRSAHPRLGTFVVLGNHEHNAHAPHRLRRKYKRGFRRLMGLLRPFAPRITSDGDDEGHAMADALRAAGITVLHNEGVRIQKSGRSVWIAGCDSAWAGHADMEAAMHGRRPGEACLALIHEPDLAFEAESLGADFVLAGHTHGGQVRLPLIGAPITMCNDPRIEIAAGFQRIEDGLLHITAGLGHTIPLRFGCRPEVVWMDCQPAAVAAVEAFAEDEFVA
jgi:predicted MPP superfamily phosphohydrolase